MVEKSGRDEDDNDPQQNGKRKEEVKIWWKYFWDDVRFYSRCVPEFSA